MAHTTPQILIIDDDPMISDAMGRALTVAGYDVRQETGGEAGLATAVSNHPALIILDYNMPHMDGLQVLNKLRADPWGAHAAVIFATNIYDLAAVNAVMRLGVTDYIMKSDLAVNDLVTLAHKYVKPAE